VCHYVQGYRIRQKVVTQPPINAYYLDSGINARLRYSITSGNEAGFFEMHDQTGELFLVREIDLETLPTAVLSLQIQVRNVVSWSGFLASHPTFIMFFVYYRKEMNEMKCME